MKKLVLVVSLLTLTGCSSINVAENYSTYQLCKFNAGDEDIERMTMGPSDEDVLSTLEKRNVNDLDNLNCKVEK